MKFNKWTVGLAAVGVVSLASAARADEQMSQVQTALSQTTLSGYVDTAMQWNPNTDQGVVAPYPGNTPPYAFRQNDGFQFNAVDIALDKPEDSSQWAAGYHVEMMYGADAVGVPLTTATTVPALPGLTVNNRTTGFDVRQAFIRLHTPVAGNGIDWQIGVFDSIIGYESNSDPLDPNYTRSYAYTIEPTTFTGILGTYKVSDNLSISAGIANQEFVNSFTPVNNFESQKAYLGSISLTAPDSLGFFKGATLSAGVVHNDNSKDVTVTIPPSAGTAAIQASPGPTTSLYAGVTLPTPVTQLKVGGSFDYLFEDEVASGVASSGADIWDIAGYATFQATDKLSLNLRAEYLDDHSAFSGVVGPNTYYTPVVLYSGNNADEITATVQYNLWANVITRGEFRWDHVEHGNSYGYSKGTGAPDRSNDFLLALNIIYQF
ncbi:MAG TPA: outer membrane beta-barrel protein [Verrucomicrobiae bacterium]|nr:outer membrane beta-barrel protein [Verrucomicrobiae bacterium]